MGMGMGTLSAGLSPAAVCGPAGAAGAPRRGDLTPAEITLITAPLQPSKQQPTAQQQPQQPQQQRGADGGEELVKQHQPAKAAQQEQAQAQAQQAQAPDLDAGVPEPATPQESDPQLHAQEGSFDDAASSPGGSDGRAKGGAPSRGVSPEPLPAAGPCGLQRPASAMSAASAAPAGALLPLPGGGGDADALLQQQLLLQ
ncbi:MAG: hypothetical protein J3K34DRAFT_472176, partial [Monoraphidium minutum]